MDNSTAQAPTKGRYSLEADPTGAGNPGGRRLESMDLGRVFEILRRHLRLIFGITIVGTALAVAVAMLIDSEYRASSRVLIGAPETEILEQNNIEAAVQRSRRLSDTNFVDTQVEIMTSTEVLERVMARLNLMQNPEFNSTLAEPSLIDYADPRVWLGALRALASPSEEEPVGDPRAVQQRKTFEALRKHVDARRVGLTYVINVSAVSTDPDFARRLANEVAAQFIIQQQESKLQASSFATRLLDERLEELRRELQAKEQRVEQFRSANDLVSADAEGLTLAQRRLSDLNDQLAQVRAEIVETEARVTLVRDLIRRRASAESIGEVLDSETVIRLRQQEAEISRRRAELSSRYRDTHPEMITVTRELTDLQARIRDIINNILTSLENEVSVARSREASLEASVAEQTARLSANAEALTQLRELERDASATRSIYETFLSRSKEVSQRRDVDQIDARVLSTATLPVNAFRPNRTVIVAAAAIISLLVGTILAVVLELMAPGVRTPDEMEAQLGLTHIASVQELADGRRMDKPYRFMLRNPLAGFSEVFRTMVATVTLAEKDKTRQVVLFTSALPAEGKTTNAMCFALTAARSGKRTVLVEADLRMPKIVREMSLSCDHGLSDVLTGQVPLNSAMLTEPETGLSIIPMRQPSTDPGALLGSDAFPELLNALKEHFDLIVLDTAPILPVGDTLQLAPLVDNVLFVVRSRKTARVDIAMALKELTSVNAKILGGVMSFSDTSNRRAYGYGNYGIADQKGWT